MGSLAHLNVVTLSNPRWLIDGQEVSTFVFGRQAQMTVDVSNFNGGDLTFKLFDAATSRQLDDPWVLPVTISASGPTPVGTGIPLAYMWEPLSTHPALLSHFHDECQAGGKSLPYDTTVDYLNTPITDDLLYPRLYFTVQESGGTPVQSPTIARAAPQFVPGNKVGLLNNGDQVLPDMLAAMDAAQHHIHMAWFFFAPDEIGQQVYDKLAACAKRGIEVRLLMDMEATAVPESAGGQGAGLISLQKGLGALQKAGVKLADSGRLVPPLDIPLDTIKDPEYRDRIAHMKESAKATLLYHGIVLLGGSLVNLVKLQEPGGIFNALVGEEITLTNMGTAGIGTPILLGGMRDHTKIVIVDGKTAYCGGLNCAKYYLYAHPFDPSVDATDEKRAPGNPEPWEKWHDCFIRVDGPAVNDFQRFFVERWAVNSGEYLSRTSSVYFPPPMSVGSAKVKVLINVPGLERDVEAEYLRLFHESTQKILVENPYITDDLLAGMLVHAVQVRKVHVDLIVPDKHLDMAPARWLMRTRYDAFANAGINFYLYQNHMNHVKAATADGRFSIVGSYNFAKSSAIQLFECAALVDDTAFAKEMEQKLFDVDRPLSIPAPLPTDVNWSVLCGSAVAFLDRII